MIEIKIFKETGSFAENKDKARDIRLHTIIPALEKKQKVILNFEHVDSATQSFIHALISELIRSFGNEIVENIYFKNCNKNVQNIINIVVEYMQAAT